MEADLLRLSGTDHRSGFQAACLHRAPESAKSWLTTLDKICTDQIAPMATQVDGDSEHPAGAIEALRDLGTFGVQVPRRFGGLGYGNNVAALVVETVARSCPSTAAILMFHYQVVNRTLDYAHPDRRPDDLAAMATGAMIGASAWTEPSTSHDKTDVSTRLADRGSRLFVDGIKTYCTGLVSASSVDVLLSAESDGARAPTFVRIDSKKAGVKIEEIYPMMGLRGAGTGTVKLTNVQVSESDVLGPVGSASELMQANHQTILNPGLLGLGIADSAFIDAVTLLNDTGVNSIKPSRPPNEVARRAVAEAALALDSAYTYAAGVITRMRTDPSFAFVLSSKLKTHSTVAAETVASKLLRACGARGLLGNYPMERHFRDALATGLMGPTNDACFRRISSCVLTE